MNKAKMRKLERYADKFMYSIREQIIELVETQSTEYTDAAQKNVLNSTICLDMILESFDVIPESLEEARKEVEQRKNALNKLYGSAFYHNKRQRLEKILAEKPDTFTELIMSTSTSKKPQSLAGKLLRIYRQKNIVTLAEALCRKEVKPLAEIRLDPKGSLFSELPKNYIIICSYGDGQIKVDERLALDANGVYESVGHRLLLYNAIEKNKYLLDGLCEQLMQEKNAKVS